MRATKFATRIAAACIAGVSALSAQSMAEAQSASQPGGNFIVGGVAALPEFEGSGDFRVVPLVIANFNAFGARIEVEGIQSITVDVVPHPVWRAGPAFGAWLPRNDNADDPRVALLPEVDFAVEVGGFVGFETPFGPLDEGRLSGDVSVRHDVASAHEGLVVKADLDYFFAASRRLRFLVGANATYANGDYFDSYFTVTDDVAAVSGLAAFDADPGLKDVGVEASAILSFSPKYALFVRSAYNRLLSDAADSPIVEDIGSENQVFVGGGLFYAF
ncbi:MAG: MipA/OmpV family protein [Pseudomonadota bacterium]